MLDEEEIVFRKLFAFTRICLNVICRVILVIGAEGKAVVRNTSGLRTLVRSPAAAVACKCARGCSDFTSPAARAAAAAAGVPTPTGPGTPLSE